MKESSSEEVVKYLRTHNDCDFIALVCTPWHELSFEASLLHIQKLEGRDLNGVILISEHPVTGYALTAEDVLQGQKVFYGHFEAPQYSYLKKLKYLACVKAHPEKVGNRFFIFGSNGPRLTWSAVIEELMQDREIVSVIVDEGLAVYIEDKKGWLNEDKKAKPSLKKRCKTYINRLITTDMFAEKLKKSGRFICCNLLKYNPNGELIQNGNMFSFYYEVIKKKSSEIAPGIIAMPDKYVLINTQPFTVDISHNIDLDFELLKSVTEILRKEGYEVVLKPHPRENNIKRYEDIGVRLIKDNNITQEVLMECFDHKPECIMSYFSTSLITANLFFGIKAISLAPMLMKNKNVMDSDCRRMNRFLEVFRNFVIKADSCSKLSGLVVAEEKN